MEIVVELGGDEICMSIAEAKKLYADLKELLEPLVTITYPDYVPPLSPVPDVPPVPLNPFYYGPVTCEPLKDTNCDFKWPPTYGVTR